MSNASSGRLRSMRDRAAVGPDQPVLGLERDEVLADRDRRDAEPGRQVADPGATVLLDDAGDVLLALPGEDVARGGAGWNGHASPLVPDRGSRAGVSIGFRGTVDADAERNVKKVIEINRNLWQSTRHGRNGDDRTALAAPISKPSWPPDPAGGGRAPASSGVPPRAAGRVGHQPQRDAYDRAGRSGPERPAPTGRRRQT